MNHYSYLIVGGGMTAHSAIQGIREVDPQGSICLFSLEKYPPYKRPSLTKSLWKGKSLETIWLKSLDERVDLHLEQRITRLDAQNHQIHTDKGEIYGYDRLLLATGGTLRKLPYGAGHIIYYRTLDDYQQLRHLIGQGKHFLVIGGGFIGTEIAAALAMNGEKVTMVFPENSLGARLFPPDLSAFINDTYRQKGVEILSGLSITDITEQGSRLLVTTTQGNMLQTDQVLAGIGILPNTELAGQANLKLENGVTVNEYLQSSQPDIFAAGDVASFYNPALGTRMRVEHEDNALTMGRHAGVNMARQASSIELVPYTHLPYFYSDMFELGYEAVGEVDSRLAAFADWQDPFHKGVVYYLKDGRVRGVLLWNVWNQIDTARKLIADPGPFEAGNLHGRIG
jgi:3-phenylpropionate/trans-cinnamate dioxygenase ferredoxin reductase subunit